MSNLCIQSAQVSLVDLNHILHGFFRKQTSQQDHSSNELLLLWQHCWKSNTGLGLHLVYLSVWSLESAFFIYPSCSFAYTRHWCMVVSFKSFFQLRLCPTITVNSKKMFFLSEKHLLKCQQWVATDSLNWKGWCKPNSKICNFPFLPVMLFIQIFLVWVAAFWRFQLWQCLPSLEEDGARLGVPKT